MKTIKIQKFEVNRRYYSPSVNLLFNLDRREDKKLFFTVISMNDETIKTTAEVKLSAVNNTVQETAVIACPKAHCCLRASVVVPKARKLSELPPERQRLIRDAIAADVARHKKQETAD